MPTNYPVHVELNPINDPTGGDQLIVFDSGSGEFIRQQFYKETLIVLNSAGNETLVELGTDNTPQGAALNTFSGVKISHNMVANDRAQLVDLSVSWFNFSDTDIKFTAVETSRSPLTKAIIDPAKYSIDSNSGNLRVQAYHYNVDANHTFKYFFF